MRDSIDGLRVTAQALLQVAAQSQLKMENFEEALELMKPKHEEDMTLMKQRFAESDQRFNIVLEEVRFLIRGTQEES
ncbi:MAG: hypothetical protein AB4041_11630 [Microcystaceae cyanobacterium]